jgi:hypothetical protein
MFTTNCGMHYEPLLVIVRHKRTLAPFIGKIKKPVEIFQPAFKYLKQRTYLFAFFQLLLFIMFA